MKSIRQLFAIAWVGLMAQSVFAIDVQNYWNRAPGIVSNCRVYINGIPSGGTFCQATWQGQMWGKTIYWHSGATKSYGGDIFEGRNGTLLYITTFQGNWLTAAGSTALTNPVTWMYSDMYVGQTIDTYYAFSLMTAANRTETAHSGRTGRTQFAGYYANYTVPETGVTYNDVIYYKFWPDASQPSQVEQYWCARGLGGIRWSVDNLVTVLATVPGMGSIDGVPVDFGPYGYVTNIALEMPSNPWYSPYLPTKYWSRRTTSVLNGNFEQSGLWGWSRTSGNCVDTTEAGSVPPFPGDRTDVDNAGTRKLCIRGNGSSGAVTTSDIVPVTAGEVYRLSGFIYRASGSENAYLDLDDGHGFNVYGGAVNFPNVAAVSSQVNNWEYVSTDFTVPAGVCGIKVRCVRNYGNVANAYFDDVRLQMKQ